MARRDAVYDMSIKLLIVGDEMTGKTPLLLKYANGTFNPNKIIKTIGIDFKIKTVLLDGKRVKLQIWDTAGGRSFKTITISYLRGAQGILLLYSVYSRHTFDSIRDWMATIRMHADVNVNILLVGNYHSICDGSGEFWTRAVTYEEGQSLADEYGIPFCEASATNAEADYEGVERAFITLAGLAKDRLIAEGPIVSANERSKLQEELKMKKAAELRARQDQISTVLRHGTAPWKRCKVMILGQGRAGKTALVNSMLGKPFEHTESTVGIAHLTCDVTLVAQQEGVWGEFKKPVAELEHTVARLVHEQPLPTTAASGVAAVQPSSNSSHVGSFFKRLFGSKKTTNQASKSNTHTKCGGDSRDEKGGDKATSSDAMQCDQDVVMKCLTIAARWSDLTISIYDFGGQSVFNIIHHLFLTRNGVYVIVFNMEWVLSDDAVVRANCFRTLRFWMQSVYIHTYENGADNTAPVLLVGTRGDIVNDPASHLTVSKRLDKQLADLMASLSLVVNKSNNLSFFPIDNTSGHVHESKAQFMKTIENQVKLAPETYREVPLHWLRAFDQMQARACSCLAFEEVRNIAMDCGMDAHGVPDLLQFLRHMGMLLWVNEPGLRDFVVLDAIKYLITPATAVICQHVADVADTEIVIHNSEQHDMCKSKYPVEWNMLIEDGVLSDKLLSLLWSSRLVDKDRLLMLMTKFGLVLPLTVAEPTVGGGSKDTIFQTNTAIRLFMVPALLPAVSKRCLWTADTFSSCLFAFFPKRNDIVLDTRSSISIAELQSLCFLPSGLFERLLVKTVAWCQTLLGSDFRLSNISLDRTCVTLPFGSQMFRLTLCQDIHCIRLDVEGTNPLGVWRRVRKQIQTILNECFSCLSFISLRLYSFGEDGALLFNSDCVNMSKSDADACSSYLVFLDRLQSFMTNKADMTSFQYEGGVLTADDIQRHDGQWVQPPSLSSTFDIFLSYRWNPWDKPFVEALFDSLSDYTIGPQSRDVTVFLDSMCLGSGRRFDTEFVRAMMNTSIAIHVVSLDSFFVLTTHDSTSTDNLLLEWVIMMVLKECDSSPLQTIFPILIGQRVMLDVSEVVTVSCLFTEDGYASLPDDVVPTATLKAAEQQLAPYGIVMDASYWQRSVKDLVHNGVMKYLGLEAWNIPYSDLIKLCSATAFKLLQTVNPTGAELCATAPYTAPLQPPALQCSALLTEAWELLRDDSNAKDIALYALRKDEVGLTTVADLEILLREEARAVDDIVTMLKLSKKHKVRDLLDKEAANMSLSVQGFAGFTPTASVPPPPPETTCSAPVTIIDAFSDVFRSSGDCIIAKGTYTDAIGQFYPKIVVKLCADKAMIDEEYKIMEALRETGDFAYVYRLCNAQEIVYRHPEGFPTVEYYGMVMAAGASDLKSYLEQTSPDRSTQMFIAANLIRSVTSLHERKRAWCDVKPANFVSIGMKFVGIDLGSTVPLQQHLNPSLHKVTTKYMCPALARRINNSSGAGVTGEELDLWSLGITIAELCNNGRTLLSGCESTDDIISRLNSLSQTEINTFIQANFKHNRGVRRVLEGVLKVIPSQRLKASELLSALNLEGEVGITAVHHQLSVVSDKLDLMQEMLIPPDELRKIVSEMQSEIQKESGSILSQLESMSEKLDAQDPSLDLNAFMEALKSEIGSMITSTIQGSNVVGGIATVRTLAEESLTRLGDMQVQMDTLLSEQAGSIEATAGVQNRLEEVKSELNSLNDKVQDLADVHSVLRSQVVQAMLTAPGDGMGSISPAEFELNVIAAVRSELQSALSELAMPVAISDDVLLQEVKSVKKSVEEIWQGQQDGLYDFHKLPLLPLLTQPSATGVGGRWKRTWSDVYRLRFVCPVCGHAPPVEEVKGIELTVTKEFVKKSMKVIKLSMIAVQIAFAISGVPVRLMDLLELVDFDLPSGIKLDDIIGDMDPIASSVTSLTDLVEAADTEEKKRELIAEVQAKDKKWCPRITLNDVQLIKTLLFLAGETSLPPQQKTGLIPCMSEKDNSCMWVCSTDYVSADGKSRVPAYANKNAGTAAAQAAESTSSSCYDRFRAEGLACLKIVLSKR